ncbi:MAG: class I SAM-dependent methyltransferase [Chloroflexi bacterium]|nr:class I SAM-dependent methyltransferase [Chloroflexota bacterium]
MSQNDDYIPAMGNFSLTFLYDPLMHLAMREAAFKGRLIEQARLAPRQRVLDVGCGTGTLAVMIKLANPEVEVVGLDGDEKILAVAQKKIAKSGMQITFDKAMSFDMPYSDDEFDRVLSSIMIHHLSAENKVLTFKEIFRVLKPGGEVHIADFAASRGQMGHLASHMINLLIPLGHQPKDSLMEIMPRAGFSDVKDHGRFFTLFGTIGFFIGKKLADG